MQPGDVRQVASSEMVERELRSDNGALQCAEVQPASLEQHSREIRVWSKSNFFYYPITHYIIALAYL